MCSFHMWVTHHGGALKLLNSTMATMAFLALTLSLGVTTSTPLPTVPRRVASGDWEEVGSWVGKAWNGLGTLANWLMILWGDRDLLPSGELT